MGAEHRGGTKRSRHEIIGAPVELEGEQNSSISIGQLLSEIQRREREISIRRDKNLQRKQNRKNSLSIDLSKLE